MRELFSTSGFTPEKRFLRWADMLREHLIPIEHTALGERPFAGSLSVTSFGGVGITRITSSAVRVEMTRHTLRQSGKTDLLTILVTMRGTNVVQQFDMEATTLPGEVTILDNNQLSRLVVSDDSVNYVMEVPRARVEGLLGPSRLYSALRIDRSLAETQLAVNFLDDLVRRQDGLNEQTRARMGDIGIDLLLAAVAGRMARETPRAIHGDVVVQRAKAHVEANLADLALDPGQVSVASGVSLRRLQELFQERGIRIADWIWERRLRRAAGMLADPAAMHLSIGHVAHACGFSSQAHFSDRFRNRHGLTPRDHRQQSFEQKLRQADRRMPARR